jgi:hypothetical protein
MNKELMKYLEKMALDWSPFGSTWDSAAKDLEEDLAKRGIEMKLYYRYALLENMTPQDFMTRIAVLHLCADFSMFEHRDIFFDKSLSLVERLRLVKYIKGRRKASREKLDEYVKFVQHANPELSKLKIENDFDKFDILAGATFGFAPDEIEYFMKRKERDLNWEHETDGKFKQFGIELHYVLSPHTAKKVIAELEKNRKVTMVNPRLGEGVRTI